MGNTAVEDLISENDDTVQCQTEKRSPHALHEQTSIGGGILRLEPLDQNIVLYLTPPICVAKKGIRGDGANRGPDQK